MRLKRFYNIKESNQDALTYAKSICKNPILGDDGYIDVFELKSMENLKYQFGRCKSVRLTGLTSLKNIPLECAYLKLENIILDDWSLLNESEINILCITNCNIENISKLNCKTLEIINCDIESIIDISDIIEELNIYECDNLSNIKINDDSKCRITLSSLKSLKMIYGDISNVHFSNKHTPIINLIDFFKDRGVKGSNNDILLRIDEFRVIIDNNIDLLNLERLCEFLNIPLLKINGYDI